ncbi:MAG: SDR family NAD(P)-dependent oxidoreductase [Anaeroplasmataceae bacterium]|nr:SDR family NAD(P)-dependent oxidoreductase [Anaeroplasmataceae bacterium]
MSSFNVFSIKEISDTIDVNYKSATLLMNYAIPYMKKGDVILNVSSASSFQPKPKLSLYGAIKSFLRSYSRAINQELKPKDIHVCAVCPGWIDTDMLIKETVDRKKIKFHRLAKKVVKKALKDDKKRKDMSVCSLYVKYEHLVSKLWPHKIIMKIWIKLISKYKID